MNATPGVGGGGGSGPGRGSAGASGTADSTPVFNYGGTVNGSTSVGPIANAFTVTEPVGQVSGTQTATLTFTTALSSGNAYTVNVLTQGATGLDFQIASTQGQNSSDCIVNTAYAVGATCTVQYTFTPTHPGIRYGGISLTSSSAVTAANPNGALASTLISGVGTGPQVAFPSNINTITLGGGFIAPYGVAVDATGNVYVADTYNNAIKKMTPNCPSGSTTCVTTLGGGFSYPIGVAVDGAGNVYVADYGANAIKEMPPNCSSGSTTCVTTLGGGFANPTGVAVDGAGNVYVADYRNNAVKKMPPNCPSGSTTCVTTLGGGFRTIYGVAVDATGNVYVADYFNNAIKEMPPNCPSGNTTCETILGGGFSNPIGVAVDGSGNIYVADLSNRAVKEMAPNCPSGSTTCVTTLGGSFSDPFGVAVDGSGNVYVTDVINAAVKQIPLATPPTVAFPTPTPDGATDTTDGTQTVTVANNGNAPLSFAIPTGSATNPSTPLDFTFNPTGTTACPLLTAAASNPGVLAVGASCTVPLTFTPVSPAGGPLSESLVFTDNALNAGTPPSMSPATHSITLQGTAIPPPLTLSPVAGALPNASYNVAYNQTFNAGGGKPPYTFVFSQPLPPFLVLSVAIGIQRAAAGHSKSAQFLVYGTPGPVDDGQSYTFTATVQDSAGQSISQQYTLAVPQVFSPALSTLTVSSAAQTTPTSALTVPAGAPVTVTLTALDTAGNPYTGSGVSLGFLGSKNSSSTGALSSPVTVNGVTTATLTDTSANTDTIAASYNGMVFSTASAAFVAPAYVVTVATDPSSGNGTPSNCVDPNISTSGNTNCSLRDAVAAADLSGVTTNISFSLPNPSTILIASGAAIQITQNVNLNGPGANALTVEGGIAPWNGTTQTANNRILQISGGNVSISGLTFANAYAGSGGSGGAINAYGAAGPLTVSNSIFSGNQAVNGGAIYAQGKLTVSSSTFSGNQAVNGGAIYSDTTGQLSSKLTASNSTFSGNHASVGGGIYAAVKVMLASSTFSGNQAGGLGGAIYSENTLTAANSIFSGDSAANGSGIFAASAGTVTNAVYNGDTFQGITPANSINADPMLAPLGNYGGPTPTLLPLPGSAAICVGAQPSLNGTPIPTDQRGNTISPTRYGQTACYDVGAVQTQYALTIGPSPVVPSLVTLGSAISPAPYATVRESGAALTAGPATVVITDAQTDLSPSSTASVATSTTNGQATFSNLLFSAPRTTDTLTATLPLNANLSPALRLTASSNSFQVGQLTPALSWPTPAAIPYGTALSATQLNATATYNQQTVQGSFSYNPGANALLAAGPHTLSVTFTPNSNMYTQATGSVQLQVNQARPGVTVSSASINYGTTSTTLTASVAYPAGALPPAGALTFVIDSGSSVRANCTGTSSPLTCTATYPTGTLSVTSHTITAVIASDTNYLASSGANAIVVNAIAPTINFSIPAHTYGDAPFTLTASSNSNAPIMFTSISGPATVSGSTLTLTGAGPVVIQASQVAAGNYTAGSQNATGTVAQKPLTVTIIGAPTKIYDGTTSAMLTSANYQVSGLLSPTSITVSQPAGSYAAPTVGAQTVTARLAASNFTAASGSLANYVLPTSASGPGTITKATPVVTWPTPAAITYGNPLSAAQLNATSSVMPGSFLYSPVAGSILGAGQQTLTVTFTAQDAADYNPVPATVQITVNPALPALTFTVPNHIYGDAPFTVSATSPSTGTITYSVVSGPAKISGTTVTLTGEGTVILKASQAASTNYLATSVQATFTVATPVVLNLLSTTIPYPLAPAFNVQIGSNNLPNLTTGTVTILDGTSVVGTYPVLFGSALGLVLPTLNAGQHSLTAIYLGDKNYTPGKSAPVTLTVTPLPLPLRGF